MAAKVPDFLGHATTFTFEVGDKAYQIEARSRDKRKWVVCGPRVMLLMRDGEWIEDVLSSNLDEVNIPKRYLAGVYHSYPQAYEALASWAQKQGLEVR